jgi:hypothetical protein
MTKTAITRNHAPSVSAALNKELAGCTDVGFIVRSHPNGVRVVHDRELRGRRYVCAETVRVRVHENGSREWTHNPLPDHVTDTIMVVRAIGPDRVTRVKRDLNRLIPEYKGTFTVSTGMDGIDNWGVLVTADNEGTMWYVKQALRTRGYWFVDSPTNGCAVWIEKQEPPKRDRTDIPDGAHMTTHGNAPHISSILKANSSAARVRKYGAHGVLIEHEPSR